MACTRLPKKLAPGEAHVGETENRRNHEVIGRHFDLLVIVVLGSRG